MNKFDQKSSFLNNGLLDKSNVALFCIFGMGVGILTSLVVLSIFTFLFGVNCIRDVHPRYWVRNKWWLVAIGWVLLYAVTYFWSDNKVQWGVRFQVKLPFLILPLAIAHLPSFTAKQLRQLTVSLSLIFLASAGYSLSFLIRDPVYYIRGYQVAHLLPTSLNDHIRTSLAITLFIIWCVYVWPCLQGKFIKWYIACITVFLALFIHILAAKTGLISLYLFLAGWSLYLTFAKRKLAGIIVLIAIPICFTLALKFLPTLKERATHLDYTYYMMKNGDRSGNLGDVNRLMSYKIALILIKEHALSGVGAGDMLDKMAEGYHQLYPQVPKESVLLPHNQFLIVALGCGIPAMLLFTIWVFMPLAGLRKNRQSFFFFMVWLILLLQLMIEPVLEVQFGVFVYLFFLILHKLELPGDVG